MLNTLLLKDGLLQWLLEFDRWLLVKINHDWSNSLFNDIFPMWRQSETWIPLYFFLFVLMVFNYGWRAFPWMLMLGLTAGVCDQVSSGLIKEWVGRLRPCRDESLAGLIDLRVIYCPQSGSFTSSHAVNHFGIATFIIITLKEQIGRSRWLFMAWAATICYGQVYVGVHYPFDVIGGGMLGILIGYAMAFLYQKQPALSFEKS